MLPTKRYDPRNVVVEFRGQRLHFNGTLWDVEIAVRALGSKIEAAFIEVVDARIPGGAFEVIFNRALTAYERERVVEALDKVRPAGVAFRIVELDTPERESLWRLGGLL